MLFPGLDTFSDTSGQTFKIGRIVSLNDFNHGDNSNLEIINTSGGSLSLQIKIGDTEILTTTPTAGVNTIEFTQEQLDNIYKLYGNNNTLTATYTLTTSNDTRYVYTETCTITLTGNQKTSYINISNNWKRRKCFYKC